MAHHQGAGNAGKAEAFYKLFYIFSLWKTLFFYCSFSAFSDIYFYISLFFYTGLLTCTCTILYYIIYYLLIIDLIVDLIVVLLFGDDLTMLYILYIYISFILH